MQPADSRIHETTIEEDALTRNTQRVAPNPSASSFISFLLSVALVWILSVGGTQRNEMLIGVVVISLSAGFAYQIWRIEALRLDFHREDIVQGWPIPWYMLSGVYEIVVIFFKDLLGIRSADSFYRVSGFKTSKSDPRMITQRVLATFYTTTICHPAPGVYGQDSYNSFAGLV